MTEEQARSHAETLATGMVSRSMWYAVRRAGSCRCNGHRTTANSSRWSRLRAAGERRRSSEGRGSIPAKAGREALPDRPLSPQAGTDDCRPRFYVCCQRLRQDRMTKHLLAGVAAVGLMSGVAFAQVYPPAPPPPPGTVVVPAPPPPPIPGSSTTTMTTVAPSPDEDHREVTIHKEEDRKGNTVIEKDTHREGIAGTSETHTKTETDRDGGTTTTRETTTKPR
jgi:hypothetical protein